MTYGNKLTGCKVRYDVVERKPPKTVLEAVLERLNDDSSKTTHLEPHHRLALVERLDALEDDYVGMVQTARYWRKRWLHLYRAAQNVLAQHTEASESLTALDELVNGENDE